MAPFASAPRARAAAAGLLCLFLLVACAQVSAGVVGHLSPKARAAGAYSALDSAAMPAGDQASVNESWLHRARLRLLQREMLVKKPLAPTEQQCTAYTRQDNCFGDAPLKPGPLPACGPHSAGAPNTTSFAIIGDFGLDGQCERLVRTLVSKFESQFGELDFVLSTGDNAYWGGSCQSLHESVSAYYGGAFFPNTSITCKDPVKTKYLTETERARGSVMRDDPSRQRWNWELHTHKAARSDPLPRFFPCLGNHDWNSYRHDWKNLPYFQYFSFLRDFPPENGHGSYYMVEPAPGLQLFSLNSNLAASGAPPVENEMHKEQAAWLQKALSDSTAAFKVVFFHHPPFSTAQHDALAPWMDLPYEEWGASLVLSGHQHVYERLLGSRPRADGKPSTVPYIINGLGGHPWTYDLHNCKPFAGSQARYNDYHGAQLAIKSWDEEKGKDRMDVCFYNTDGTLVDHFDI